ncbi:hypothetical protein F1654_12600 [Alkalicaulis satelles]|uniref:DUF4199 domain-containing protein n=1 Tax=Alkalicaulis satelles TaxID=2609175 RepID=A0A5M6ZAI2_9PROT|nr:hypothetical protein [Alkalicaulis satelles]KAA5801719.1 hypothetical protein F1654_12600 [Alkalicaulis satelles]
MPPVNFAAAFLPNQRADADQYWIALGLIAAVDFLRLSLLGPQAAVVWPMIAFFVLAAHINRLRHAGRRVDLAVVPLLTAWLGKFAAGVLAMTFAVLPLYMDMMDERGVDINDPAAVSEAAYDPAFQQALAERLSTDEALARQIADAGAWPSMWAFWIVIGLFAVWFARMGRDVRPAPPRG